MTVILIIIIIIIQQIITTLGIIGSLAGAMGSSCSKFNKIFIPGVLGTLVDAKVNTCTCTITCIIVHVFLQINITCILCGLYIFVTLCCW